jgi:hypothetical protein
VLSFNLGYYNPNSEQLSFNISYPCISHFHLEKRFNLYLNEKRFILGIYGSVTQAKTSFRQAPLVLVLPGLQFVSTPTLLYICACEPSTKSPSAAASVLLGVATPSTPPSTVVA